MEQKRKIEFWTTESKSKLIEGSVHYQGQIIHNLSFGEKEARKNYAEYSKLQPSMVSYFIDSLGEFIRSELAKGHRLNFGPFAVGLGLRGSFPSANAPFDEKRNTLAVELLPCAEMKKVVHKLKPINVTENCRAEICSTLQVEPELWKRCDIFAATGTRVLSTCGIGMEVHPRGVGEGAWIENDIGEKLLTGEVIESDYTLCKYRVSGDIAPGSYWVVISSRHTRSGKFLSSRRRIVAV